MLPRVLEPEVMDSATEAADYDAMDHTDVNRRFVDDLLQALAKEHVPSAMARSITCLDVGTGTALIPIELCRRAEGVWVVGIDLAASMLALGSRNVAAASLSSRITLECVDAKHTGYADATFDAVISNSIVHHIPAPAAVWREMLRILRPGGLLFVRDLLRLESAAEIERVVEQYTGGESLRQQQLFRQSLHAALTLDEVAAMVEELGLSRDSVCRTSDRHWTVTAVKPL